MKLLPAMEKIEFLHRLGQNIVRLRKEKGWTQSELADKCDKEKQSIERVENGKINPTAYYLSEIAAALEVPVSELFNF